MIIEYVKVSEIKANDDNPRYITEDKFIKLKKSIQEFPDMLEKRPLIVDENMIVLGGNMRLKALKDLGIKQIPIIRAIGWTEDQKREFIIKDNLGFGSWEWDTIANEWNTEQLIGWGMDVPEFNMDVNVDNFFADNDGDIDQKFKVTLDFTEEDYNEFLDLIQKHPGSRESIILNLLRT